LSRRGSEVPVVEQGQQRLDDGVARACGARRTPVRQTCRRHDRARYCSFTRCAIGAGRHRRRRVGTVAQGTWEPAFDEVVAFLDRPEQILDWDTMVKGLEGMTPAFEPGTKNGYHAVTFGFIVGEIVRRVSGLGITDFVRTHIAEPLALDGCYVGLPRSEHGRLVETITSPDAGELTRDPAAMVR